MPLRPPPGRQPPPHLHRSTAPDTSLSLLFLSCVPLVILLALGLGGLGMSKLRERNGRRKREVIRLLEEEGRGKRKGGAASREGKTIVGFWHPYCNAGGGGERVLWTAIAYLQRTHGDSVISLVYTGDYPEASKAKILGKVKTRFGLSLQPHTIHLVPLPARRLVSDSYWRRFTLVGQSLGSVFLALQGLGIVGSSGLWGDYFIDTMGYAFSYPVVRLFAGPTVPIGAYVHYPTISEDMVQRVRERRADGVENRGGVAASGWKTRGKVIYYTLFMRLYSLALLFSSHTMTNSSWTQAHVSRLLYAGRASWASTLMTFDEPEDRAARVLAEQEVQVQNGQGNGSGQAGEGEGEKLVSAEPPSLRRWTGCEVVYPPCDTTELEKCGKLDKRERVIVSLAQFRPEKDHATQLHALSTLFARHSDYRGTTDPKAKVKLIMMGSSRNAEDEQRIADLRELAVKLDVQDNVKFVVNAPYSEIIATLSRASIGMNTMRDEHFGINVVEFMAAGLIPLVHQSAGPYLDIVVPYRGQITGYHATDAEGFAEHMHTILTLPPDIALRMRTAARKLAGERFSQAGFEAGWEKGWRRLQSVRARRKEADKHGHDRDRSRRRR